jgi:hypothetical protein
VKNESTFRDGLNQVVVIVVTGVILVVALAVVLGPTQTIAQLARALGAFQATPALQLQGIAGLIGGIAFVTLLFELRPSDEPPPFEARVDHGVVEYLPEVVASTVELALQQVAAVHGTQVALEGNHRRVKVRLSVAINPGADPQATANELARVAGDAISNLGLELVSLRVLIRTPEPTEEPAAVATQRRPQPVT